MDNVQEMGKFLQITSSKTEQKEIENMSKPITSKEVESVTQKKKTTQNCQHIGQLLHKPFTF